MTTFQALLALLLAQQPYTLEQEPPDDRAARLGMLATSIDRAAHTRSEAAALATIAILESRLAAYVQEGRCHEAPVGAPRCDRLQAFSPFQLHVGACRTLVDLPAGSQVWLDASAECAVRLWRYGEGVCHSVPGAFGVYAGRRCDWMGGLQRAVEYDRTLTAFLRIKARP